MAHPKNLLGERYGQLVVVARSGTTRYGGRQQSLWLCHCDCGQDLELAQEKLPHSPGAIRAANRAGRLPYTCCETCRQKTCPICGDRFSYSHTSYVCPSPDCQETLRAWRDAYWHGVASERYRTDLEYRARVREQCNAAYRRRADEILIRRRALFAALPADEQVRRLERRIEAQRIWYADLRADSKRYGKRVDGIRRHKAEMELAKMLADAQQLHDKSNSR